MPRIRGIRGVGEVLTRSGSRLLPPSGRGLVEERLRGEGIADQPPVTTIEAAVTAPPGVHNRPRNTDRPSHVAAGSPVAPPLTTLASPTTAKDPPNYSPRTGPLIYRSDTWTRMNFKIS